MKDMDKWRKDGIRAKFREVTSLLDAHRQENFEVFPELEDFYPRGKKTIR